jgi:hypothetical protein
MVPSAPYVVTNINSSGPGSLAGAVAQANADTSRRPITITFAAGRGQTFATAQTIHLDGNTLMLTNTRSAVTIKGSAAGVIIADDNFNSRDFQVSSGVRASFFGFTIEQGGISSTQQVGGGILNHGSLSLTNCHVSGNAGSEGGAIYNDGVLIVSSSVFDDNETSSDGGAIFNAGRLTAKSGCLFGANHSGGFGGAIFSESSGANSFTATSCIFAGNTAASGDGGAIANESSGANSCIIKSCTIAGNTAAFGGGIFNESSDAGSCTIKSCSILGNSATTGDGGGVFNESSGGNSFAIASCTIGGNSAEFGGGIAIRTFGVNSYNLSAITYFGDSASVSDDDIFIEQ